MEKDKDKSFSYYLSQIYKQCKKLKKSEDINVSKEAIEIENNLNQLKKAILGVRNLIWFMFVLIIFLISLLILTSTNYKNFRSIIMDDNQMLKDSLLEVDDYDGYIEYLRENGKLVTYNDLRKKSDSIELAKLELELELGELERSLIRAKSFEKISNIQDSLIHAQRQNINDLSITNYQLENKLNSKSIDSALILLNAFRHRMKYDPSSDMWIIDTSKKK